MVSSTPATLPEPSPRWRSRGSGSAERSAGRSGRREADRKGPEAPQDVRGGVAHRCAVDLHVGEPGGQGPGHQRDLEPGQRRSEAVVRTDPETEMLGPVPEDVE